MGTNQDLPSRTVADEPEMAQLRALSDRLSDTLRTAEALVRTRRRVDLTGLDEQIGGLCARTLQLPPSGSAALRPKLLGLMARTDSLLAAVAAAFPDAASPGLASPGVAGP